MFNNFYDRFKNFMKENFLFLLFLILFIVVTFVRVPYEVNMPGGVINLGNRVTVDGESVSIDGTFNMAYVSVVQGSILFILYFHIFYSYPFCNSRLSGSLILYF